MTAALRARRDGIALQVAEVSVDGGYRPQLIEADAGIPLRLMFHRRDPDSCSDRVVFSSPRIERRLALGKTTIVDLPPQPVGEVRYTCGMGRYRARIRFVAAAGPRRWLEGFARRQGSGLVLGAVMAVCGLPLIVLVLSLMLGTALWPALGFAVAAWLAGCLAMGWLLDRGTGR